MAKKKGKKQPDARGYSTTSMAFIRKGAQQKEAILEEIATTLANPGTTLSSDVVNLQDSNSNSMQEIPSEIVDESAIKEWKTRENLVLKLNLQRKDHLPKLARVTLSKDQEIQMLRFYQSNPHAFNQSVVSVSWSSSLIENLKLFHLRMIGLGFDKNSVKEILANCASLDDIDSAFEWACLHLPIQNLPPRFSDKFDHDDSVFLGNNTGNIISSKKPIMSDEDYVVIDEHQSDNYSVRSLEERPEEKSFSNKDWIMNNSMESDSSDNYSDVDIYLQPAKSEKRKKAEMESELKELIKTSKISNDKKELRECGKKIGRLVKELGIKDLSDFNEPAVDVEIIEKNEIESQSGDDMLFFAEVEEPSVVSPRMVSEKVYNITKSSAWTGSTPQKLLQNYVSKKHKGADIKYTVTEHQSKKHWSKVSIPTLPLEISMQGEYVTRKEDARDFVALKALYHFGIAQSLRNQVDQGFRDIIDQWIKEKLQLERQETIRQIKELDQDIDLIVKERQQKHFVQSNNDEKVKDEVNVNIVKEEKKPTPSLKEWTQKTNNTLLKVRQALPAFSKYQEIVDAVQRNRVIVISGETGSGKSTQIPQFLLQSAIESSAKHFNLICTQPRRISAMSLASRVAQEQGGKVAQKDGWIGYQVRNDSKTHRGTRITYCTTGILLQRLISDPLLYSVTHLVIDECHERTLDSDLLLFLIKKVLECRTDLRVVLMSATANASHFAQYFASSGSQVPMLFIEGRTFPVTTMYLEDILKITGYTPANDSEYIVKEKMVTKSTSVSISGRGGNKYRMQVNWQEALSKLDLSDDDDEVEDDETKRPDVENVKTTCDIAIKKIIDKLDPKKINFDLIVHIIRYILNEGNTEGSVLCFLPGAGEISKLMDILKSEFATRNELMLDIYPLHSNLSNEEQALVFKPATIGKLKVVLSTNIAETGVTIPDAVYVIDSLRAREINHDQKRGISKLVDTFISKANAKQRRGRAGRVQNGVCFHLVPEDVFEKLPEQQVPEMQRLSLEEICLKMRTTLQNASHIGLVDLFQELLDPPPLKNVQSAVGLLKSIEALDANEAITDLGKSIGQLPVNARIGKMLLLGVFLGCLDPILTIASVLSIGKTPFRFPSGEVEAAKLAHAIFSKDGSDYESWVVCFNTWQQMFLDNKSYSSIRQYCTSKYLSFDTLVLVHENRQQLLSSLVNLGYVSDKVQTSNTRFPKSFIRYPLEVNMHHDRKQIVAAAVGASLYPNLVWKKSGEIGLSFFNQMVPVKLHDNSKCFLEKEVSGWFCYHSITMKPTKHLAVVYDLGPVSPLAYLLLSGHSFTVSPLESSCGLDDIQVVIPPRSAHIVSLVRKHLNSLFTRFLVHPGSFVMDPSISTLIQDIF